jgi:hypothetical protein
MSVNAGFSDHHSSLTSSCYVSVGIEMRRAAMAFYTLPERETLF